MSTWSEGDVLWTCEGEITGFKDGFPRPFICKYVRRGPENYDHFVPSRSIIRVKHAKGWSRSKDAGSIRSAVIDAWPDGFSRAHFAREQGPSQKPELPHKPWTDEEKIEYAAYLNEVRQEHERKMQAKAKEVDTKQCS